MHASATRPSHCAASTRSSRPASGSRASRHQKRERERDQKQPGDGILGGRVHGRVVEVRYTLGVHIHRDAADDGRDERDRDPVARVRHRDSPLNVSASSAVSRVEHLDGDTEVNEDVGPGRCLGNKRERDDRSVLQLADADPVLDPCLARAARCHRGTSDLDLHALDDHVSGLNVGDVRRRESRQRARRRRRLRARRHRSARGSAPA